MIVATREDMGSGILATIKVGEPPRSENHSDATWESLAEKAQFRASDLARLLGISLRTLQRYFRAKYDCTVSDWLRELRLALAHARLPTCSSVKEVAFDLGYKQPSHFTRDFKQRFGVPPRTLVGAREHTILKLPVSS
jgi:transcriptional regulator GlxA family with amidase domain